MQQNTFKMIRYKTESGLVAFYKIWPEKGMGLFLQPRSPHGAPTKVGLSGAREQFWPDSLPVTTNDSHGLMCPSPSPLSTYTYEKSTQRDANTANWMQ